MVYGHFRVLFTIVNKVLNVKYHTADRILYHVTGYRQFSSSSFETSYLSYGLKAKNYEHLLACLIFRILICEWAQIYGVLFRFQSLLSKSVSKSVPSIYNIHT